MDALQQYAHSLELSGISDLVLPPPPQAEVTQAGDLSASLVLIFQKCSTEEYELLQKMFAAIDIALEHTLTLEFVYKEGATAHQVSQSLSTSKLSPSAIIVPLGPEGLQECIPYSDNYNRIRGITYRLHGHSVMPIDHPRDLRANPELKKRTWATLLQIKKTL